MPDLWIALQSMPNPVPDDYIERAIISHDEDDVIADARAQGWNLFHVYACDHMGTEDKNDPEYGW